MSKTLALRIVLFFRIALDAAVSSFPLFLQPSSRRQLTNTDTYRSSRSLYGKADDNDPVAVAVAVTSRQGEVDHILRTRRTINKFHPTLMEGWEEIIQDAIISATYAPNHKRTEPWKFHLLGSETIRQICELNAELVSQKKGPKAGERKLERWLQMPGWLVVTCQKTVSSSGSGSSSGSSEEDGNGETTKVTISNDDANMDIPSSLAREDYAAVCCAVQNLCLSLHAAGMGTKWTTGKVNFDARFDEIVGIDAKKEYVVGTIWFGTPENAKGKMYPDAPLKKKTLEDVLIRSA